MTRRSDQKTALANPTQHALVPGIGYVFFDWPIEQLPYGWKPRTGCEPQGQVIDGSKHRLKTPGGNEMEFIWMQAPQAWSRHGGKRIAFAPSYLASHGWAYAGPV